MNTLFLLWFFFLAFLIFIGIPFGLAYLIDRFIWKKGFDKRYRLIALLPILFLSFIIFRTYYPGEDFYRDDFKEVTNLEFPKNGSFLYKTSTFPDHFGDYSSTAITFVGKDFYKELSEKLLLSGFKEETISINTHEFQKYLSHVDDNRIEKKYTFEEEGGKYFVVCFLSDKKTLLVQRISW